MNSQEQFKPLLDAMENGVKGILGELIDGTIEDLDGPIREISARLALAARRGRKDLVDASKDQLAIIVLEKRLRIEGAGDGMFEQLLGMGIDALIGGAIGGLGSLRR
jgi:hypothetical protein